MLDSWYEVFVLSYLNVLCIMTKDLHFVVIYPKEIVPEVLWLVHVKLFKPK